MYFKAKIVDLVVGIHAQFSYIKEYMRDYVVEEYEAEFEVFSTLEEIEIHRQKSNRNRSDEFEEVFVIFDKICKILPKYNRFLMHGAVISYEQNGYVFTAPSGVGKTTHIHLWKDFLGEKVTIMNGDKTFFQVREDGIYVYGSPLAGKEGWNTNTCEKLKGICFLSQGNENVIKKISKEASLPLFIRQIYRPNDVEMAGKVLELLNCVIEEIPLYSMKCDISEDALQTSFEAMTGLDYRREIGEIKNEG